MRILLLLLAMSFATSASAGACRYPIDKPDRCPGTTFRVVPPEVAKDLEILRIPTTDPIPLIVGHYWKCRTEGGRTPIGDHPEFEICDLVTVVCTSDQSFCVEN